jgi:osmotically-inducible protein OsmY
MGFWCAAAGAQWPPDLSQYKPLSVARQSSFGQNLLELAIRSRLRAVPHYGVFDRLAYRVEQGNVTLFGQVMRPELRFDAEEVVKELEVEGVHHVYNEIRFLTVSPPENELRKAVFVAIYTDRGLRPYSLVSGGAIHIVVEGKHVTLDGEVSAEADRQRAAALARSVHGVAAVENQITVSW